MDIRAAGNKSVAEARKNASTVVLKQFVCSFEQRGDS
jgi:hypothetical protein